MDGRCDVSPGVWPQHRELSRTPLHRVIRAVLRTRQVSGCGAVLLLSLPLAAYAQTFPTIINGANIGPVTVGTVSGNTQVQGGSTITSTGQASGLALSGGFLAQLNTQSGTSGPIAITTVGGTAVQNNGGTVDVPYAGLAINTGNGIGFLANSTDPAAPAVIDIDNGASVALSSSGAALGAYGAGAAINATTVSVNLNGGNGRGAVAQGGGVITLGGTSAITSTGGSSLNALALGAAGAGSVVNVTSPATITMNSPGALGVYMYAGGIVQLPQNQVFTFGGSGAGADGITVDSTQVPTSAIGSGLTLHFNAASSTSTSASTGVVVIGGGSISLTGLTVDGPNAATGVWVRNGSTATLDQGQISVSAVSNTGFYTLRAGQLLNPGGGAVGPIYVGTFGLPNAALKSDGGTINANGTQIVVNSTAYTAGGYAWSSTTASDGSYPQAVLNLNQVKLTSTGPSTYGLLAQDGGQINATASQISNDSGIAALALSDYGTRTPASLTIAGSTVTATGTNSAFGMPFGTMGLDAINRAASGTNVVTLTGTSLSSQSGTAIEATGPLQITVQQGSSITGGGDLLYAYRNSSGQATQVQLDANDSTLSGLAQADSQSNANITLSNHSAWTGESYYVTNIDVDATSSWTIPAGSVVSQQLLNNGLVQFTAPTSGVYKSLYVHDYTGSGTLGINTFLGDDSSPTDRLYINGGTAGSQGTILVHNTGGPGALTSDNGIPVVEVLNGGTTLASAFALAGPVVAGPYEYTLERGGASPGTEDYWFLRSTINCEGGTHPGCPQPPAPPPPPDPPGPPVPQPPGPPTPPPDPPPVPPDPPAPPPVPEPEESEKPTPEEVVPNYRPEVSLYTALPGMALRYGWATLGDLHERVGDEEQLRNRSDLREDNTLNALWVRVIGEDGNVRGASQGIYNGSPQYDYNIIAFQAGMDIFAEEHENEQRDHAGLYLGTGRIRSDVTNYDGNDAGDDIVKGQSLGLYWTHFWAEGQYLDAVWQGTWSKYSAKSDEGLALNHNGFGWAGSLEGGYPFHNDTQVWEPQAQVIYQRINNGQSSDAAALVNFSNITSLVGRVGLRWANTWTLEPTAQGAPRLFTGWLRFNLWKEFKGEPTTSFSSEDGFVPFDGSIKGSWWQLNGGMTWELDKNTSFYANVGYQKGFDSRGFHAWDGKVGFRWNW